MYHSWPVPSIETLLISLTLLPSIILSIGFSVAVDRGGGGGEGGRGGRKLELVNSWPMSALAHFSRGAFLRTLWGWERGSKRRPKRGQASFLDVMPSSHTLSDHGGKQKEGIPKLRALRCSHVRFWILCGFLAALFFLRSSQKLWQQRCFWCVVRTQIDPAARCSYRPKSLCFSWLSRFGAAFSLPLVFNTSSFLP